MTTIGSSALATVQARRFTNRAQGNMRKRGGSHAISITGGRASLYKQMYGSGSRNGVKEINFFRINFFFLIRKLIPTNNLFMLVKMEIIIQYIVSLKRIRNLTSMLPIN